MITNRLIRLREVLAATGLARSTLYLLISQNKFPKPVKLTERTVAWPQDEIQEWIDERIEDRDEGVINA